MKNPQTLRKVCPGCGGVDTQLSRLRWFERFLAVLRILPFRCLRCGRRFRRFV